MPPSRRSSKQSSTGKCETTKSNDVQSQWIMMVKDEVLEGDCNNDDNKPVFCKLKHPKSEQAALFLFSNNGRYVYEATRYKEEFRSWFIDEDVQKDGSITMATPVDPVFLVMPYMIKAGEGGKYMTLDQIVTDPDHPECNRLLNCSGLSELSHITDMKGGEDFQAYKFDKEKTLSWLKLKTENVAAKLEEKGLHVSSSGSHSAMFVRSKKEEEVDRDLYTRYACGMVSDYLPLTIAEELRDYLGIKEISSPVQSPVEPPAKRAKLEDITPTEDYSSANGMKKQNSKEKLTGAQKRLSKVDKSGMKSISSFFSPKTKT